jgi:hypothetical protein
MNIKLNGIPFVDAAIDHAKEHAKEHIQAQILDWIGASLDVLKDISFTVALIGGGICILICAITGIRRAGKLAGLLVLIHVLIRAVIGGGV